MGGFLGTLAIVDADRDRVAGVLKRLRRRAVLMPAGKHAWAVADERADDHEAWKVLAKKMADRLSGVVLGLYVHDDDFLQYRLYAGGKPVDRYHSCPDYFGEEEGPVEPRGGDAGRLSAAFPGSDAALLRRILHEAEYTFAGERMRDLCSALGLDAAAFAYTYAEVADAEEGAMAAGAPAERIHVGKPKPELDAPFAGLRRRLEAEGVLRQVIPLGLSARKGGFYAYTWFPDKDGHGLFIQERRYMPPHEQALWCAVGFGEAMPSAPPLTGLSDELHAARFSPDGKWLAGYNAGGDWTSELWSVATGQRIVHMPHASHATNCGAFSPDRRWWVSASDRMYVVDLSTGKQVGEATPTVNLTHCTFHPDNRHVVACVDQADRLLLFDAIERDVVAVLQVGWQYDFTRPGAALFSPDGRWLALTGHHGVGIWDWAEARGETACLPPPRTLAFGAAGAFFNSLAWDDTHGVFIAASHGGWLRSERDSLLVTVEPVSGAKRVLLSLPGNAAFLDVYLRGGDLLTRCRYTDERDTNRHLEFIVRLDNAKLQAMAGK